MFTQDAYSDWNTAKAVAEGYKTSYIYYSAASDLADCAGSVPWGLRRKTPDGSELVDNHPLAKTLRQPNPETTFGALIEAWSLFKYLAGNAYGKIVAEVDPPIIWMLRPDRIGLELYEKGPLKGHVLNYKYFPDGAGSLYFDRIPPEQMAHFKFFDPGDDHFGLAPLKAAARLVDTSNDAVDWNRSAMKKRSVPSGMLSAKGPLSDNQYAEWKTKITEQIQGSKNARGVLISGPEAVFQPFDLTPVEMDFIKSMGAYEDAILKTFPMHPEALGKSDATYENKRWALRAKWEGPIPTNLREIRRVLNHRFGPLYGTAYPPAVGDLYIDYDLSDTPGAAQARQEMMEVAPTLWACGMPWNQVVQELGLGFEESEGGDVGYVSAMLLPVGMSPEGEGRSTRTINPSEASYRSVWTSIVRRKEGWARGVAVKVSEEFRAERKAVLAAIDQGHADVDYVIDGRSGAWKKLVATLMRAVAKDFGDQIADELNQGRSEGASIERRAIAALSDDQIETRDYEFDPWNELIKDFVETKTAEHITEIAKTTKAAVRKAIKAGLDEGESMVKIAARVKTQFNQWEGGISSYRAMLIARTEVHTAAGFAMHESARQSGVAEQKHWLDAGDDRVRVGHVNNTGAGWIGFDESYPDGAMHPGDGTDDVGCRCVEMFQTR